MAAGRVTSPGDRGGQGDGDRGDGDRGDGGGPQGSRAGEVPPQLLENHLGGEEARNYRAYQHELVSPHCGRSVLEVGAGLGELAASFTGLERQVLTDSDPYCLDRLRRRFQGRPGVEVMELSLPGPVQVGDPVESVIAMNVLEHIEDDSGALRQLAAAVVPGGRVVLWVPGYPALYGDFDRKVGHVRRYTPATLRAAVEGAGLRVELLRPVNLLGGLAWWLAVRVGGTGQTNPRLIRLYDRGVLPLTRLIERRVQPPFGQSLLCVARVATEAPGSA
ncbi:MAG: class I SAM-dependent methyltransferase [Acidimicrobiales bacterium]